MKTIKDFIWWLSVGGVFKRYWDNIEYFCNDKNVLVSDFIQNMDANKPDTLFWVAENELLFFKEAKEKYINWLKDN
ncbi:hypothetical protein M2451_002603 [Dysgonomonas sp. PFB1-18]|uniref:hypothetical protein n=1 Tax=unclassified Dysgonomonas TaxID=2630389 RepID=UPI002475EBE7|nr:MULTISPECIES: hypothetical protein [unclassified Dysgonomonas]MDH6308084.1 hypothetical protein [Dysgonomonas sp. PF1-14]MDH6339623.1 hypothetical protein [Dysgonomonas sp. PF1-16]MDH6381274.1 hypothetical protein [Dysgonomonas sp. PFB1-18]MDH6398486.1 hypothetical protein [Dysgonomonas sp. PF1-23]